MRILFLSTEYPPQASAGGIATYVQCMAAALAGRGHEVHVLCCTRDQTGQNCKEGEVWVHRRRPAPLFGFGHLIGANAASRIAGAAACWSEVRELAIPFDVIEAPDWGALGLFFSLLRSYPVVGHLHAPINIVSRYGSGGAKTKLASALERASIRHAQCLTSPSLFLVNELRKSGWLDTTKVSIIPLPIDLRTWEGLPSPDKTSARIVQVGRLEPAKAPEVLVDAAAILSREVSVELLFVGRNGGMREGLEYVSWVRSRAEAVGVPCQLVSEIPREELPELLATARIAAVPSRFDNFPMAGLEAMAAGRAIVCTDSTGLAEMIRGSDAGAVVPPDDPEALAEALRPFILNPALAAAAGRRARELVEVHCSPDGIASLRERAYSDAIVLWKREKPQARSKSLSQF